MDLLGKLDGSVIRHRDLESILTGVPTASDAAVRNTRHGRGQARHEVQLGEVHGGRQLAHHVHGTLALWKREKGKI